MGNLLDWTASAAPGQSHVLSLYSYAALLFQSGCFKSQKPTTKALKKDTTTMEISSKTGKKKKVFQNGGKFSLV